MTIQKYPVSEDHKSQTCLKFCWEVTEEEWKANQLLELVIKPDIHGSYSGYGPSNIYIYRNREEVGFEACWPLDIEVDKIEVEAKFWFKSNDGQIALDINPDTRFVEKLDKCHNVNFFKKIAINPEKIYDEQRCFSFEAQLKVKVELGWMEEMLLNIYHDEKNADVTLVVGDKKFQCHKNVLCARSRMFNNMFTYNTIEKQSSTVYIEDATVEVAEAFIKFLYTGKLPSTTEGEFTKLFDVDHYFTRGLLHVAIKYQVQSLEDFCFQKLLDSLNVASCIPTYILVDSYNTNIEVKEEVKKFMTCKAVEVIDWDDWYMLVEKCPNLAKELFKAIAEEVKMKHLCKYCVLSK